MDALAHGGRIDPQDLAELRGRQLFEIAQDESLLLCWAAANRDPKVYDDPDTFSLDRKQSRRSRHMTFGFGIHACPGASIARMEMKVALEELLRRAPGTELKDGAAADFEFRGTETAAIPSLPATVSH